MNKKKPILRIEDISKSFGKKTVFEKVSFDLFEGDVFGLVGLSGSGKTTLLNILCGYVDQDEGSILYSENSSFKILLLDENKLKSFIGFSSQEPSFYLELSVIENLKYFGSLQGVKKDDIILRSDKLLKLLKLNDSKNIKAVDLSEGMKKRLDIAIALINNPKILILDEPTSNLDILLREELYDYIKKINGQGVTVIFVSHYIEEVKILCNRVGILSNHSINVLEGVHNISKKFEKIVRSSLKNE